MLCDLQETVSEDPRFRYIQPQLHRCFAFCISAIPGLVWPTLIATLPVVAVFSPNSRIPEGFSISGAHHIEFGERAPTPEDMCAMCAPKIYLPSHTGHSIQTDRPERRALDHRR